MFNMFDRFVNTLLEYNNADVPDYEVNPFTGDSWQDFMQAIAENSASGFLMDQYGIVTITDGCKSITWNVLDYSCIYEDEKINLASIQPYTDENFIKGLIE